MKILTPEIKQTLDFITPEETILLTGKKDSGKATAIEALAKSPNVQKLLQLRENTNAPGALIQLLIAMQYQRMFYLYQ